MNTVGQRPSERIYSVRYALSNLLQRLRSSRRRDSPPAIVINARNVSLDSGSRRLYGVIPSANTTAGPVGCGLLMDGLLVSLRTKDIVDASRSRGSIQ